MSKSNGQKREPLFHIVKRSAVPSWAAWLIRIGAVVLALLVCAVVTVVITGQNPAEVYSAIIFGAVGSPRRIWSLLQNLAMLLCVSLAVTPAFKMNCCGRDMGFHPRILQGEVVHQRDALHADDELHRNADRRLLLLQVVEPQGLGSHRSHQQRKPQRLASESRRSGLPAQHTYRCGADRFHVHLSQIQQARL